MPPTAKYKIKFNGNYLSGYAQAEELPINARNGKVDIVNRDGGTLLDNGADFRSISFSFDILTRLGSNSTGLAHLGDCLEQYRDTLRFITRVPSASTLFLGDTSHYLIARYSKISAPLAAPDSRRIKYNVEFAANPWFYGPAVSSTDAISGNSTITLNMPDTRKTYPAFQIPSGITRIAVSHTPSGKSFMFSGSHASTVTIDCARLTVVDTSGVNHVTKIVTGPDFGIYHTGSGSSAFIVTSVTGAGNVITTMLPRLER